MSKSEQEAQVRMQKLFDLFTELSEDQSYHFDKVLKRATELVKMDIGIISHIEGEKYEIKAIYSAKKVAFFKGQTFDLKDTYCSLTFKGNKVVDLNHIQKSDQAHHPCYKNTKMEAYLGVPIWVGNKKYGTLNFSAKEPRAILFNQFDRDFVLYLGQWLGQHIARLEFEQKLDEKNKQLQELLDEREKLSSILIHDLKSPLNNLSGLLDLSESMTNEHVISDMMKNSLSHAFGLITDLQEINQLELGLTKFQPSLLNAVEIAEIITNQFMSPAKQKNIELVLSSFDKIISLESDMKLLCRVLNNLVSNAIKFSPASSVVEISTYLKDGRVYYEISDQGPGISKTDQKKMFGRFQKLSARPTGAEHSSGLGLFIVKENCKLLGAQVEVESAPGEGATFTLSLPQKLSQGPGQSSVTHRAKTKKPVKSKKSR